MKTQTNLSPLYRGEMGIQNSITTVWLYRHANAPREKGQKDEDRKVSSLGDAQCLAQCRQLGGFKFNRIFVSPIQRVGETVRRTFDRGEDKNLTITPLDELWNPEDPEDDALVNKAFDVLGYAPLADYFKNGKVGAAFDRWAYRALKALGNQLSLSTNPPPQGRRDILICGHAVYLPLLGYYLLNDERSRRLCFYSNMAECDVIRLGFDPDGTVAKLFPCPPAIEEPTPD